MKLEESNMSDAWHNGQPNGGKGENCVTATDTGFVDDSCDSPHCGICELPTSPTNRPTMQWTADNLFICSAAITPTYRQISCTAPSPARASPTLAANSQMNKL